MNGKFATEGNGSWTLDVVAVKGAVQRQRIPFIREWQDLGVGAYAFPTPFPSF